MFTQGNGDAPSLQYQLLTDVGSDQKSSEKTSAAEKATEKTHHHEIKSSVSLETVAPLIQNPLVEMTTHVIKDANENIGIKLDQVVIKSPFIHLKGEEQAKAIIQEFNKNVVTSSIVESDARGTQIPRDEFWLVHRNKVPELRGWSQSRLALPIVTWFGTTVEDLKTHKINKRFFGAHGSYVLNVPPGKYALAWTKNKTEPLIYGEGPHVIHDPTFSFDDVVVSQTEPHIEHGYVHILQIPVGKIAKIWESQNLMPTILPSRHEPYVFNSPYFKLDRQGNPQNESFENLAKDYIRHGNIHILRVPVGKVAKIWFGSNKVPMILISRQEPYEFNCPYLEVETKGNPDNGLFDDATKPYIKHGSTHIVRIPPGNIAKVWFKGNKPEFLRARTEPYLIDDPLFRLDAVVPDRQLFEVETQEYIQHGSKHIIRVPPGKLAKVWYGTIPKLLEHHEKPYEIDDPTFRLERASRESLFENQGASYIQHGTKHVLRVPTGKVAKVCIGSEAKLLEAQKAAYEYDDPTFRLIHANENDLFEDASAKLIEHGALKRIIPPVGEVAILNITDDKGFPKVVKPTSTGEPHYVTSSSISIKCWLPTTVQNLVFPSEKAKRAKLEEKVSQEIAKYEIFRTSDGADIGVKLYVSIMIEEDHAALAARILKDEKNMLTHIEDVTQTDMRRAISQVSFQDITTGDLTRPRLREPDEKGNEQKTAQKMLQPSAPRRYIQDEMREQLAKDLRECGVTLVRLDILECEPLDAERVKKAKEASISTAQLSVEAATMDTRYRIDLQKAKQNADVKRVDQEQQNENLYKQKEAELRAAKAEAEAVRSKSQGEADAKLSLAKATAEAFALEAKAKNDAELLQAQNLQKIALLKAENEQNILLIKAANEAKAIKLKAEADAEAVTLKAAADQKSAMLKIECEKLELQNKQREVDIRVNATLKEIAGIAEAFAKNKEYSNFKTAEASAPILANALSKANFNVLAGLSPQELLMALMSMQSGMNLPLMMTTGPGVGNSLPFSGLPSSINPLALFAPKPLTPVAIAHSLEKEGLEKLLPAKDTLAKEASVREMPGLHASSSNGSSLASSSSSASISVTTGPVSTSLNASR